MKNKIVIYSALFGNIDNFKEPKEKISGCDYVYFTDNTELKSDKFDIRKVSNFFKDTRRAARMFKLLPHRFFPEYDYSIWVDASIKLKTKDIMGLVRINLDNNNLAVFKHMHRKTLKEEVASCIERKKDNPYILLQQYRSYLKEGFQEKGLVETGVLLRKHLEPEMIKFNEEWWKQVNTFSVRDQVSFPYVSWKYNFKYKEMDGYIWENNNFEVKKHNEKSSTLTNREQKVDHVKQFKEYIAWSLNNF